MIDLDKSTIRLIGYINCHAGVTERKLLKKFGDDGTSLFLINLSNEMYLVPQDMQGKYFIYGDAPWTCDANTRYYATPKAKAFLENRRAVMIGDLRGWLTTAIAVAAFVKSFFL
ncbi:MAG: hypothetical protein RSD74_02005 [Angelakisella sp.]